MATTDESPGRFPVAINGRPYAAMIEGYVRQSLDLFRQQADSGREFDEGSLNPQDLWRRSQVDWRLGAGVEFLDRSDVTDSARRRFAESTGIDPWMEGGRLQLAKAHDGIPKATTGGLNRLMVTGTHLVSWVRAPGFGQNGSARFATDPDGTWTLIPGLPTGGGTSIMYHAACTDGRFVYFSLADMNFDDAKEGIWRWDSDSPGTDAVKINDLIPLYMAFVRGRLMAAGAWLSGSALPLYNITDESSTAIPDPISTGRLFTVFGASSSYILAAHNQGADDTADPDFGQGARSTVYRIAVREDGAALGAPVACGELPDGEHVHVIQGYAGVILLGTSKGFRIGQVQGGELTYGPLVEVDRGVKAIEPQGNYAWLHVRRATLDHTMIRVDLSRFTEPLLPAWASDFVRAEDDRWPTDTGAVTSTNADVHTWNGKRVWTMPTTEAWLRYESDDFETAGSITSGTITFGITEPKVLSRVEVQCEPLPEDATLEVQVLDGAGTVLESSGALSGGGATRLTLDLAGSVNIQQADSFRVRLLLGGDGSVTPVVTRWTLFANPVPRRGERIVVPLDLREEVADRNGRLVQLDPYEEFLLLKEAERAGVPVQYQEFGETHSAFIDQIQFGPELDYDSEFRPQGTCTVVMRVFA